MKDEKVSLVESLAMFNALSIEIRSKIDGLVKQVLFLSGGVQAITIGAFFSGKPPHFPAPATELLRWGWLSLSVCIVLCLVFMLGHVLTMICVGLESKKKLEQDRSGAEVLVAPKPLRVLNWVVGLSAFVCCAAGMITISLAAMALIGDPAGS
ncbi:hypothetical protein [Rhodanobacter ginsenosidimutans]|jgi:hypothetical protein|uniref:Transmembrane protein n=1 Tax=Rhodanobacter ginsenosidimutans TaxID=490571 RepID=A0ABW0JWU3_9GAMM